MPKISFDFDKAIQSLKETQPEPGLESRLIANIQRRPTRITYRLPLVIGVAAAVAAVAVWPTSSSNRAFAQSMDNTLNATCRISKNYDKQGNVVFTTWDFGKKHSSLLVSEKGHVFMERRSDGVNRIAYIDFPNSEKAQRSNPNYIEKYGLFSEIQAMRSQTQYAPPNTIDELIKAYSMTLDRQEPDPKNPGQILYFASERAKTQKNLVFVVDSKTMRVVSVRTPSGHQVYSVEYPESIDPSIFKPELQTVKVNKVFDLPNLKKLAAERIEKGLARKDGITVRLVALDHFGNLWSFWTGSTIDGKMSTPVRFPSLKVGSPFGPSEMTTSYIKSKSPGPGLSFGRLSGMGCEAKVKVGETVDLEIPKGKAYVRFLHLPVMRIATIDNLYVSLGLRHR